MNRPDNQCVVQLMAERLDKNAQQTATYLVDAEADWIAEGGRWFPANADWREIQMWTPKHAKSMQPMDEWLQPYTRAKQEYQRLCTAYSKARSDPKNSREWCGMLSKELDVARIVQNEAREKAIAEYTKVLRKEPDHAWGSEVPYPGIGPEVCGEFQAFASATQAAIAADADVAAADRRSQRAESVVCSVFDLCVGMLWDGERMCEPCPKLLAKSAQAAYNTIPFAAGVPYLRLTRDAFKHLQQAADKKGSKIVLNEEVSISHSVGSLSLYFAQTATGCLLLYVWLAGWLILSLICSASLPPPSWLCLTHVLSRRCSCASTWRYHVASPHLPPQLKA